MVTLLGKPSDKIRREATVNVYGKWTGSDGCWREGWLRVGWVGWRRWTVEKTQEVCLGEASGRTRWGPRSGLRATAAEARAWPSALRPVTAPGSGDELCRECLGAKDQNLLCCYFCLFPCWTEDRKVFSASEQDGGEALVGHLRSVS